MIVSDRRKATTSSEIRVPLYLKKHRAGQQAVLIWPVYESLFRCTDEGFFT